MNQLTAAERALVALGAALGSNCVPCVQAQVPAGREAGLTDGQIGEALEVADQIRRVPARDVLLAAWKLLSEGPASSQTGRTGLGCGHPSGQERPRPTCCP